MNIAKIIKNNTIYCVFAVIVLSSFIFQPAIDVEVTHASKADATDGKLEITVHSGNAPYECQLFEGIPWDGGILIDKDDNIYSECTFKNLRTGKYVIFVRDSENQACYKQVEIAVKDY